MRKIGILGGSFDPVHNGHLLLAQEALEQAKLDEVLFMPTWIQPFKQDVYVTPAQIRLILLYIATRDRKAFDVTEVEIKRGTVSYTIDSLRQLREDFGGDAEVHFIVGSDMLVNMEKWHMAAELLREFPIIVGLRPGTEERDTADFARHLETKYGAKVIVANNRMFDVSSTDIKDRVRTGRSIRHLVPEDVLKFIYVMRMYKKG
jgi:nicotinate-nucleotide adenylyltransferase